MSKNIIFGNLSSLFQHISSKSLTDMTPLLVEPTIECMAKYDLDSEAHRQDGLLWYLAPLPQSATLTPGSWVETRASQFHSIPADSESASRYNAQITHADSEVGMA